MNNMLEALRIKLECRRMMQLEQQEILFKTLNPNRSKDLFWQVSESVINFLMDLRTKLSMENFLMETKKSPYGEFSYVNKSKYPYGEFLMEINQSPYGEFPYGNKNESPYGDFSYENENESPHGIERLFMESFLMEMRMSLHIKIRASLLIESFLMETKKNLPMESFPMEIKASLIWRVSLWKQTSFPIESFYMEIRMSPYGNEQVSFWRVSLRK